MAHMQTLARPYAKAILAQATTRKAQESWKAFLDTLATMLSDDGMRRHVADAGMSETLISWVNEWMSKQRGKALTDQENNFLRLVAKQERLSVLPDIAAMYAQLLSQSQNICLATVYSAKALQPAELTLIQKALVKKTGKAVELSTHTDKSLLAGVYIEYDGQVIDQTMKGRIARFAHSLAD